MTGRSAGYCAGYNIPGFMNRLFIDVDWIEDMALPFTEKVMDVVWPEGEVFQETVDI